jgi:hypothetical protein
MNIRALAIALVGALLAARAPSVSAQPGYMRNPEVSKKKAPEEEPAEEPQPEKKRPARKRAAKPTAMGNDKAAIEAYLQSRLGQLQKAHRSQETFGRKLNTTWEAFWGKVFKERKLFEVRIARQRLDLFESLGSLDNASHGATIADYERLQSNQMKAFEDSQRQKMAEFFNQMLEEVREYSVDQERARQDFLAQALDAWQQQKGSQ